MTSKPVPQMSKALWGKLVGDRGYLSQALFEQLFAGLQLITPIKTCRIDSSFSKTAVRLTLRQLEFRRSDCLHLATQKAYSLRPYFCQSNNIVDKYEIVEGVWGDEHMLDVDDSRIEKLVSRLRQKVEPDPSEPVYITTVRGRGYRLVTD